MIDQIYTSKIVTLLSCVTIALVAASVIVSSASAKSAKLMTRAQAMEAMNRVAANEERTGAAEWGVESATPNGCKRTKNRRSWKCELVVAGHGNTGWVDSETGEPLVDDYVYTFTYMVTGDCRRATATIVDPWLEEPQRFNVCKIRR